MYFTDCAAENREAYFVSGEITDGAPVSVDAAWYASVMPALCIVARGDFR